MSQNEDDKLVQLLRETARRAVDDGVRLDGEQVQIDGKSFFAKQVVDWVRGHCKYRDDTEFFVLLLVENEIGKELQSRKEKGNAG